MTPRTALSGATTTTLADGLRTRLPGLAAALDEDYAAVQVGRLLPRGTAVREVTAAQAWLRPDGTCTLRYDVRLDSDPDANDRRRTVLCRVHPDESAAAQYLATRVLPLVRRCPPPAASMWREWAVVVAGTGIALHPFPLDPELPTLGQAVDPALPRRLIPAVFGTNAPGSGRTEADSPPDVRVVHYPRQGACVLRYDVGEHVATNAPGGSGLFGKVYGGESGALVARRLHELESGHPHVAGHVGVRFPSLMTYDQALRLLLTEALPGSPVVPRLLTHTLVCTERARPGAMAALSDAVGLCGHALSALHVRTGVAAPEHSMAREMTALRRELDTVAVAWPKRADVVRRYVPAPSEAQHTGRPMVLCHGDFTPSQVLLTGAACGVVDLDDLCRADPALDLGRFLASLSLLAAKTRRVGTASLTHELTAAFLDGYRTGAHHGIDVREPTAGVHFYRRVSLARSALHACRQLKDDRFARAVALLESDDGAYG